MRHSSQDTLHASASSPLLLPRDDDENLLSSTSSLMSNSSTHVSSFGKASKRPRPELPRVHFAETATLHFVSNTRTELSRDELYNVYYSRRELETMRRKSKQLVETFDFYSDEDLMDRFGLPSVARQVERVQEIHEVRQCVMELEYERAMELENKEGQRQQHPTSDMHHLVEEYYRITQQSTELAVERARRMQEQVTKPERSPNVQQPG